MLHCVCGQSGRKNGGVEGSKGSRKERIGGEIERVQIIERKQESVKLNRRDGREVEEWGKESRDKKESKRGRLVAQNQDREREIRWTGSIVQGRQRR